MSLTPPRRIEARPRVLVLATTLPATPGDGTPEFVLSLSSRLAKDFDITIVAPRIPSAAGWLQLGRIPVYRFPYFPRRWEGLANGGILPNLKLNRWRAIEVPFFIAAFLVTAIRVALKIRPEVVHAHWLLPSGLVAWFLRTFLRIPYLVTAHGADVHALRSWPLPYLKRVVIRRASLVSPASREMAMMLGFSESEADQLVVPMGVDVEDIETRIGERVPESGRLLFVGRLEEKKGIDTLLRAMALVPEAELVIIGNGSQADRLHTLSRHLNVSNRVEFLGRQPRSEVINQLRRAQALVVPSRVAQGGDSESTPLVMSEAMAAGVPVIASDVGGLSEQIVSGLNGLLVEPDSPNSLAKGLRRVISEKDHDSWVEMARHGVRATLDIDKTASRYHEFILSIIQHRHLGRTV